jgi:UDPglucose 6-dehydrogenase
MKIAVLGLWHLGSVTAACLSAAGHSITGFDPDPKTVADLAAGTPPVAEPGLKELIAEGLESHTLQFSADRAVAVRDAEIVWVAFDTPVGVDDVADVNYVVQQVEAAFPYLADGTVVLCSSQLPVGSLRSLERAWSALSGGRTVSFACSPENLRLGKAIDVFRNPDRVVIGVRDGWARAKIQAALAPITSRLEWMSVESAEMTKHAVNAFLATSVTFINELASLCERAGADAKEVERGLKSESRIGPHAYLAPGGAFAGGTLARDVSFLRALGTSLHRPTPLMDGVMASNAAHAMWAQRRLDATIAQFADAKIAVWGLTYKPGTDTLRRSSAMDLSRWLVNQGADVHVHDPMARDLPHDLRLTRHSDPVDAATGARALVVATGWPCYKEIDVERLASLAPDLLILDASRFLGATLGQDPRFRFVSVGQPE